MKRDRNIIIDNATVLFLQYGTKSVSMGDIASNCGVSKKTIYVFFDSKEMLIAEILKSILSESAVYFNTVQAASLDVLSEMKSFHKQLEEILSTLTPSFIREVRKYYPVAYNLVIEFRKKAVLPFVTQNIIKGVYQNIYRPDIDANITGQLYCWQFQNVYESTPAPLPAADLLKSVNNLFLRSIVNATRPAKSD